MVPKGYSNNAFPQYPSSATHFVDIRIPVYTEPSYTPEIPSPTGNPEILHTFIDPGTEVIMFNEYVGFEGNWSEISILGREDSSLNLFVRNTTDSPVLTRITPYLEPDIFDEYQTRNYRNSILQWDSVELNKPYYDPIYKQFSIKLESQISTTSDLNSTLSEILVQSATEIFNKYNASFPPDVEINYDNIAGNFYDFFRITDYKLESRSESNTASVYVVALAAVKEKYFYPLIDFDIRTTEGVITDPTSILEHLLKDKHKDSPSLSEKISNAKTEIVDHWLDEENGIFNTDNIWSELDNKYDFDEFTVFRGTVAVDLIQTREQAASNLNRASNSFEQNATASIESFFENIGLGTLTQTQEARQWLQRFSSTMQNYGNTVEELTDILDSVITTLVNAPDFVDFGEGEGMLSFDMIAGSLETALFNSSMDAMDIATLNSAAPMGNAIKVINDSIKNDTILGKMFKVKSPATQTTLENLVESNADLSERNPKEFFKINDVDYIYEEHELYDPVYDAVSQIKYYNSMSGKSISGKLFSESYIATLDVQPWYGLLTTIKGHKNAGWQVSGLTADGIKASYTRLKKFIENISNDIEVHYPETLKEKYGLDNIEKMDPATIDIGYNKKLEPIFAAVSYIIKGQLKYRIYFLDEFKVIDSGSDPNPVLPSIYNAEEPALLGPISSGTKISTLDSLLTTTARDNYLLYNITDFSHQKFNGGQMPSPTDRNLSKKYFQNPTPKFTPPTLDAEQEKNSTNTMFGASASEVIEEAARWNMSDENKALYLKNVSQAETPIRIASDALIDGQSFLEGGIDSINTADDIFTKYLFNYDEDNSPLAPVLECLIPSVDLSKIVRDTEQYKLLVQAIETARTTVESLQSTAKIVAQIKTGFDIAGQDEFSLTSAIVDVTEAALNVAIATAFKLMMEYVQTLCLQFQAFMLDSLSALMTSGSDNEETMDLTQISAPGVSEQSLSQMGSKFVSAMADSGFTTQELTMLTSSDGQRYIENLSNLMTPAEFCNFMSSPSPAPYLLDLSFNLLKKTHSETLYPTLNNKGKMMQFVASMGQFLDKDICEALVTTSRLPYNGYSHTESYCVDNNNTTKQLKIDLITNTTSMSVDDINEILSNEEDKKADNLKNMLAQIRDSNGGGPISVDVSEKINSLPQVQKINSSRNRLLLAPLLNAVKYDSYNFVEAFGDTIGGSAFDITKLYNTEQESVAIAKILFDGFPMANTINEFQELYKEELQSAWDIAMDKLPIEQRIAYDWLDNYDDGWGLTTAWTWRTEVAHLFQKFYEVFVRVAGESDPKFYIGDRENLMLCMNNARDWDLIQLKDIDLEYFKKEIIYDVFIQYLGAPIYGVNFYSDLDIFWSNFVINNRPIQALRQLTSLYGDNSDIQERISHWQGVITIMENCYIPSATNPGLALPIITASPLPSEDNLLRLKVKKKLGLGNMVVMHYLNLIENGLKDKNDLHPELKQLKQKIIRRFNAVASIDDIKSDLSTYSINILNYEASGVFQPKENSGYLFGNIYSAIEQDVYNENGDEEIIIASEDILGNTPDIATIDINGQISDLIPGTYSTKYNPRLVPNHFSETEKNKIASNFPKVVLSPDEAKVFYKKYRPYQYHNSVYDPNTMTLPTPVIDIELTDISYQDSVEITDTSKLLVQTASSEGVRSVSNQKIFQGDINLQAPTSVERELKHLLAKQAKSGVSIYFKNFVRNLFESNDDLFAVSDSKDISENNLIKLMRDSVPYLFSFEDSNKEIQETRKLFATGFPTLDFVTHTSPRKEHTLDEKVILWQTIKMFVRIWVVEYYLKLLPYIKTYGFFSATENRVSKEIIFDNIKAFFNENRGIEFEAFKVRYLFLTKAFWSFLNHEPCGPINVPQSSFPVIEKILDSELKKVEKYFSEHILENNLSVRNNSTIPELHRGYSHWGPTPPLFKELFENTQSLVYEHLRDGDDLVEYIEELKETGKFFIDKHLYYYNEQGTKVDIQPESQILIDILNQSRITKAIHQNKSIKIHQSVSLYLYTPQNVGTDDDYSSGPKRISSSLSPNIITPHDVFPLYTVEQEQPIFDTDLLCDMTAKEGKEYINSINEIIDINYNDSLQELRSTELYQSISTSLYQEYKTIMTSSAFNDLYEYYPKTRDIFNFSKETAIDLFGSLDARGTPRDKFTLPPPIEDVSEPDPSRPENTPYCEYHLSRYEIEERLTGLFAHNYSTILGNLLFVGLDATTVTNQSNAQWPITEDLVDATSQADAIQINSSNYFQSLRMTLQPKRTGLYNLLSKLGMDHDISNSSRSGNTDFSFYDSDYEEFDLTHQEIPSARGHQTITSNSQPDPSRIYITKEEPVDDNDYDGLPIWKIFIGGLDGPNEISVFENISAWSDEMKPLFSPDILTQFEELVFNEYILGFKNAIDPSAAVFVDEDSLTYLNQEQVEALSDIESQPTYEDRKEKNRSYVNVSKVGNRLRLFYGCNRKGLLEARDPTYLAGAGFPVLSPGFLTPRWEHLYSVRPNNSRPQMYLNLQTSSDSEDEYEFLWYLKAIKLLLGLKNLSKLWLYNMIKKELPKDIYKNFSFIEKRKNSIMSEFYEKYTHNDIKTLADELKNPITDSVRESLLASGMTEEEIDALLEQLNS